MRPVIHSRPLTCAALTLMAGALSTRGEPSILFDLPGHQQDPSVSPDGSRLAFAWTKPGEVAQVVVRRFADGALTPVTSGDQAARLPRWSPDGSRIAFVRGNRIWTIALSDIARGPREVSGSDSICCPTFIAGFDWSPDGRHFAYAGGAGVETHIEILPADGGTPRRLTEHAGGEWFPRWSPDGRRLSFYSTWNREMTDVWAIGVDGSGLTRITDHPGEDFRPAFSPDGKWIVFTSRRDGTNDLWAAPSLGGAAVQLTNGHQLPLEVHWHQQHLVLGYYPSHSQLWAIHPSTGKATQLTTGRADQQAPAAAPQHPVVALSSNAYSAEAGIVLLDPRRRRLSPLLVDAASRRFPAWSPDGRWLAFRESSGGFFDSTRLCIAAADGTQHRCVAALQEVGRPVWSADGTELVFQATGKLWRVGSTSGEPRPLPGIPERLAPLDVRAPDRVFLGDGQSVFEYALGDGSLRKLRFDGPVAGARWSRDGRHVAFLRSNGRHNDLYIAAADGSAARRLTTGLEIGDWPTWSADSKTIYVTADNGKWKIAHLSPGAVANLLR